MHRWTRRGRDPAHTTCAACKLTDTMTSCCCVEGGPFYLHHILILKLFHSQGKILHAPLNGLQSPAGTWIAEVEKRVRGGLQAQREAVTADRVKLQDLRASPQVSNTLGMTVWQPVVPTSHIMPTSQGPQNTTTAGTSSAPQGAPVPLSTSPAS